MGVLFGCLAAYLLKKLHLSVAEPVPCLTRNLGILLCMQLSITLSESSQGFVFWSLIALLAMLWLVVYRPVDLRRRLATSRPAGFSRQP